MTSSHLPFRFAVQGGPFADGVALAEHARRVEALGYDELYTADHIGAVDPFVPLVVAAVATERLRIGPLVLNNELHHPVLLARTAATVDAVSGGRLVLGIGTGYLASEHDSIGSPIRPPGPRVERLGETLHVLRALLDTGAASFHGEHVHVDVSDLGVRPAHRVPLLVGGHGPRLVAVAARHADIFQFTGLTHGEGGVPGVGGFDPDQLADRARRLTEGADGRRIERSALVQFVHVGDGAPTPERLTERFGLPADAIDAVPFVLVGSVEQIVDKLGRLRGTLGISHYVVRDPDGFAPVVDALRGR